MLTATDTGVSHNSRQRTWFWCQANAVTPLGQRYDLGTHTATTPRLALRWLRSRTQDVADQLDWPGARPAHHWLTNKDEHERALARLAIRQPYGFTLFEDGTRYVLLIRPAP